MRNRLTMGTTILTGNVQGVGLQMFEKPRLLVPIYAALHQLQFVNYMDIGSD